jgi:ribonuclease P protein subunit RPR2
MHDKRRVILKEKTLRKKIAYERIIGLFEMARKNVREDPVLAQRYVDIAKKISSSYKVRIPSEYKRQICKHCKSFIIPGINCRTRIQKKREPHIVITCLNCGGHMRIPLGNRQKSKK